MSRPRIGITGPDKRLAWGWWFGALAVWLAWGKPLRITPKRRAWADHLEALDGLIIGGGDDIDPNLYGGLSNPGEPPDPAARGEYDAARDALEKDVIERAFAHGLPMLGICRGAQLINVSRGGTLIDDLTPIRKHTSNRWHVLPRKTLIIKDGSGLAGMLGRTRAQINSLHHQAVDQTGDGLRVVGRDKDNIIQAIEWAHAADKPWLLGVQWHPEYIPQRSLHRRIFKALVAAARTRGRARTGPAKR